MNLFVTDSYPDCARDLDDVRLNKMILESCQMLMTALVVNGLPPEQVPLTKKGVPFKTNGFRKHPVTVWTGKSRGNYEWHLQYLLAALNEFRRRFNKEHSLIYVAGFASSRMKSVIPDGDIEPFVNCSLFKDENDVVEAYRKTMNAKWKADKIKVKWTNRNPPKWISIPTVEVNNIVYRVTAEMVAQIVTGTEVAQQSLQSSSQT